MNPNLPDGYEPYSYIRVERHQIKSSHKDYKYLDSLCFKAKNLYNLGLYTERQFFFEKHPQSKELGVRFLDYNTLYHYLKNTEAYKDLPACASQQILRLLVSNFKSFFKANQDYKENPSKYLGRPKLPKYKHKEKGRFSIYLDSTRFSFSKEKDHTIIDFKKKFNNFKIKTTLDPEKHELKQARFIPRKNYITIEIAYGLKENPSVLPKDFKYPAGIDIGIDNFSTISIYKSDTKPLIINGKGLKSYNKYFNKKLSHLKSEAMTKNKLHTTKKIQNLIKKRNNYIETWIHQASRMTADYIYKNQVRYIVIGKNKNWKQESKLSKKVNQTFIQIPYDKYINQLIYKCQDLGMIVYVREESYTSGTSFIDNEPPIKEFYDKKRRIYRGLFKTNQDKLINSDVNASFQIIKKVFNFIDFKEIYNLDLNPIRINVA